MLLERGGEISFHSNNAPRSESEGEDHYNVEMPNFSLRLLKTDGGGGDRGEKNPFAICDFFEVGGEAPRERDRYREMQTVLSDK